MVFAQFEDLVKIIYFLFLILILIKIILFILIKIIFSQDTINILVKILCDGTIQLLLITDTDSLIWI